MHFETNALITMARCFNRDVQKNDWLTAQSRKKCHEFVFWMIENASETKCIRFVNPVKNISQEQSGLDAIIKDLRAQTAKWSRLEAYTYSKKSPC